MIAQQRVVARQDFSDSNTIDAALQSSAIDAALQSSAIAAISSFAATVDSAAIASIAATMDIATLSPIPTILTLSTRTTTAIPTLTISVTSTPNVTPAPASSVATGSSNNARPTADRPTAVESSAGSITIAANAASTSATSEKASSGLSSGAIAGIAVGVILGVLAVAGGAFLVWRRQKRRWAQNAGTSNGVEQYLPEPADTEKRSKGIFGFGGGAVAGMQQTPPVNISHNDSDVNTLPELVSIENQNRQSQKMAEIAERKQQAGPDELRTLQEEERRISEAIAHAEHMERLREEQRAVQSRIREARGDQP